MLYQDYKAKINRRVKIRRILRKYRVPIISTLSAIVMLLAAFAITKGMIFGDSLESNKIEYGNKPTFTASAVFSDVRYEFCEASGNEWSTEVPVHMGEYKMRVVANGYDPCVGHVDQLRRVSKLRRPNDGILRGRLVRRAVREELRHGGEKIKLTFLQKPLSKRGFL